MTYERYIISWTDVKRQVESLAKSRDISLGAAFDPTDYDYLVPDAIADLMRAVPEVFKLVGSFKEPWVIVFERERIERPFHTYPNISTTKGETQ